MQFVINSNLNFPFNGPTPKESMINGIKHEFDDMPSKNFLTVNSCGFTFDDCIAINTRRPDGRGDYQLLYLQEGVLNYKSGDDEGILNSGEILLFRPNERQIYTSDPMAVKMYFVHFTGTAAAEILASAGLSSGSKYQTGKKSDLTHFFNDIIEEFKCKQPAFELFCAARLMTLIAHIGRILIEHEKSHLPQKYEKIIQTINYMSTMPADMSTVSEYAERAGLTECYFITLFKEYTGKSPLAYRTEMKIHSAITLLSTTQISVTDLAEFLGYSDSLYFSRLFKKHTGTSPANFRKNL